MSEAKTLEGLRRFAPVSSLAGSCAGCKHSFQDQADLVCRRMPPQVTILLMPAPPPRINQVAPQALTSFPIIRPDMWCGEFARKSDA